MSTHISGRHPAVESANPTAKNSIDPFGILSSQAGSQLAWLMHPQELWRAADTFSADLMALYGHTMRRTLGLPANEVYEPNPEDARFADPIWTENAQWDILKEWYLTISSRLQEFTLETPGLSEHERHHAAFWQRNWLNMAAPTNFFWLNPQAT